MGLYPSLNSGTIPLYALHNYFIMFYVNSKKQWYYYEDLGESKWYANQLINYLDLTKFMHKDEGYK